MAGMVHGSLALVTGGSSGIGRETCRVLAREGATVVVTCIDEQGAQETLKSLPGSGHTFMRYDVSKYETAPKIVKTIIQKYERPPNILVNCAGIIVMTPVLEETPESFQRIIDVNLKGTFFTSQAVCQELIAAKLPGAIVNISSVTVHRQFAGVAAYVASKFGVEGVTRCLSKEMSDHNIRVNDVEPSCTDTAMIWDSPQEIVQGFLQEQATKRVAHPQEIAEVITFLASDRASYINGTHVPVTGGL